MNLEQFLNEFTAAFQDGSILSLGIALEVLLFENQKQDLQLLFHFLSALYFV